MYILINAYMSISITKAHISSFVAFGTCSLCTYIQTHIFLMLLKRADNINLVVSSFLNMHKPLRPKCFKRLMK